MSSDPATKTKEAPSLRFEDKDSVLQVFLGGDWNLREDRPNSMILDETLRKGRARKVVVSPQDLKEWDSSLLLSLLDIRSMARARDVPCEISGFSPTITDWLKSADAGTDSANSASAEFSFPITRTVGLATQSVWFTGLDMIHFLGESVIALGRIFTRPASFRWAESILQMQRCGAQALGIVGLISFLVGVILAFVAATQLRQFGADIFVANLVGLAVLREMGPMMAAIVLAGRTGAAYAAELGNMRLNEEIDALETFGVNPHEFLVSPRMAALILMMPLLAIYANLLGISGGVVIAQTVLDVPPQTFYLQLRESIGLSDVATGLLKSVFFGMIVAYSGCLKGMRADRSAVGVGEATTAAVVLGILLIIVADAIFTVMFNALRW